MSDAQFLDQNYVNNTDKDCEDRFESMIKRSGRIPACRHTSLYGYITAFICGVILPLTNCQIDDRVCHLIAFDAQLMIFSHGFPLRLFLIKKK